jgi:DNA-binding NarL/FixJ family response regulator
VGEELSTPIRVLVIDDSAEIRDAVRLALARDADFELVAEASTGETGVSAAMTHQPDLVLLDIAMPDMDGLQALPLIRSAAPGSGVVVLSGFSEQDAAALAVEQGAHAFIRKGVSVPDLLGQMREVVRRRR